MITKDTFLVSFNIQGEGFCEPFLVTYRTEELNPYLRYPRQTLNPNHLHVYFTKQVIRELMGIGQEVNLILNTDDLILNAYPKEETEEKPFISFTLKNIKYNLYID